MPEPPRERRRRPRPAPAAEPDDDAPSKSEPSSPASQPSGSGLGKGSPVWPLVAGLAIGFAVGREAYRFGLSDTRSSSTAEGDGKAFIAADKAKPGAYAKQSDFPAKWIKESDLPNSGTLFAGLTDAQKVVVMQALNERDCECGCGMGALALCLQKDPNCPRSPQMAKLAVDLVKQGKTASEIEAAIDAKQKEMGGAKPAPAAAPEPPKGPVKVELAAWNPRKGPKQAKVTVVEFSDFQ